MDKSNFKRIDKTDYCRFFNEVQFKTFFHNSKWHDFLEAEFRWLKFEYYLYKNEAILPLARFRTFGEDKLVSLPFCEYGGPLLLVNDFNFEEFKACAISEFGENIRIKFHPQIILNQKIENDEPGNETIASWIEDLKNKSEKEILNSFRKTLKHEIRDAQNKKLIIRKCGNSGELKQFYGLYVANLRRKKTVPYPFAIFEFLFGRPETEILLALYNDKIISGDLFLNYGKFTHYFFSATDYKYRKYGAAHLLLWEKIRDLVGKDKILDLGATQKDSSLDTFKRGWGGRDYPIMQIGIKKSPKGLRSSRIRNIWGLLPNFAIKALSSKLIKYRI